MLVGLGTGLAALLSPAASEPDPAAVLAQSQVIAAARGRVEVEGGLSRILAAHDRIVREVRVAEGQQVKDGEVLAVLDERAADIAVQAAAAEQSEAQARLQAAQAKHDGLARQVDRLRRAAKAQAVTPQALDDAEAGLAGATADVRLAKAGAAVAAAKLASARLELDQRQIRAALDGEVVRRTVKPGDTISAAAMTELFVIMPNAPLVVRAEIQEQFVRQIKPGLEADIVSESDEHVTTVGRVLRMGQFLDTRRSSESVADRVDVRVADCIVSLKADGAFLVGQRVYVRFKRPLP
ncbi:HlyD family efflux transporter periplasmic adaptor subunit [Segnochrobactrum spirostomi]|uniref:HlyD family efflux transporter periplasmic adaptor subunit n=1 Tax=Segnochrobactrum spirostomi TaxID=2608987 RepID=UPI001AD7FF9A|nr:HlyD family efflux transporter periplasmic adaptor subunit [Segnochrobactrum spirostomi]